MKCSLVRSSLVLVLFASGAQAAPGSDRLVGHTSILGVRLEEHRFEDVFRILGRSEVKDNGGDAAANGTTACYVGADGTTLALISDGELGGGWLTSLHLAETRTLVDFSSDFGGSYVVPKEYQPHCKATAKLSHSTKTAAGLGLGITREETLRLLGPPCDQGPDTLRFCSEEKGRSTPKQKALFRQKWGEGDYETFDIFRWVHVTFRNGRATAIRVDSSIT